MAFRCGFFAPLVLCVNHPHEILARKKLLQQTSYLLTFGAVQLLYPIFLIAGLSLLIPIIIHLFNLRRYKTVFFPHTRFLKNLQLHSKKQSQVRYKWLLAARLLFLLFLIFAFAQPYFAHKKENNQAEITAIYIDNSQSMSLRDGQRSMLDLAKEQALQLLQNQAGKYLILSNDKPASYTALSSLKAIDALNAIQLSPRAKNNKQVLTELQSMLGTNENASLYYLSDFQQNDFATAPEEKLLHNIRFNGVQIEQKNPQNIYIDTAFFESPVIQTGQNNKLIVRTKYSGDKPKTATVVQMSVDGKIKSAATPVFTDNDTHTDTLSFSVNNANWQKIILSLNDGKVAFDDSFFIAARSSPDLSVLLINDGAANPYLLAALRSYSGFKITETSINNIPTDTKAFNLILVSELDNLNSNLSSLLQKALANGQNVCLFFKENASLSSINLGLKPIADIELTRFDTTAQNVATMQTESRLIKDMFERMPDNVQLPFAQNHYQIKAGLSANQQAVFSFRNGDPFLAQYNFSEGQLHLCATPPNERNGNFQSSYFFVPFLYQMASLANSNHIFAIEAGQKESILVKQKNENAQGLLHIRREGIDVIPAQRAEGMGIRVAVGEAIQEQGFYELSFGNEQERTIVGVHVSRTESDLAVWNIRDLKKNWNGKNIFWQAANSQNKIEKTKNNASFPLWKLCSILALLMLGIETYLLSKNLRKTNTNL